MPFETLFADGLKVKVIGVELVLAITGIFMHRIQNNFAQLLSSRRRSAVGNICLCR